MAEDCGKGLLTVTLPLSLLNKQSARAPESSGKGSGRGGEEGGGVEGGDEGKEGEWEGGRERGKKGRESDSPSLRANEQGHLPHVNTDC